VNLIGPVGSGSTKLGSFGTAAVCSMAYAVKVTCLGRLFTFERKGTGNHTHNGCSAVLGEFQFFGLELLVAGGLRIWVSLVAGMEFRLYMGSLLPME